MFVVILYDSIVLIVIVDVYLYAYIMISNTDQQISALNEPPFLKSPTLNSTDGASTESTQSIFQVIVFTHGFGGMRTVNSGVCCDLASHGFIVGAVEHRCVVIACFVSLSLPIFRQTF